MYIIIFICVFYIVTVVMCFYGFDVHCMHILLPLA